MLPHLFIHFAHQNDCFLKTIKSFDIRVSFCTYSLGNFLFKSSAFYAEGSINLFSWHLISKIDSFGLLFGLQIVTKRDLSSEVLIRSYLMNDCKWFFLRYQRAWILNFRSNVFCCTHFVWCILSVMILLLLNIFICDFRDNICSFIGNKKLVVIFNSIFSF